MSSPRFQPSRTWRNDLRASSGFTAAACFWPVQPAATPRSTNESNTTKVRVAKIMVLSSVFEQRVRAGRVRAACVVHRVPSSGFRESIIVDDVAAVARAHRAPGIEVDAVLNEVHQSVAQKHVD